MEQNKDINQLDIPFAKRSYLINPKGKLLKNLSIFIPFLFILFSLILTRLTRKTEIEPLSKLNLQSVSNHDHRIFGHLPIINSFLSNYFGGNFRHYIDGHITLFPLKCLKNLLFENSFKILKIEKPYFKTDYFTFANVMRLFNPKKLSPPYRGSIMTIYAQLKN